MRIFLAGDHLTGTGPANVTKYYIDNLPEGTLYQKKTSKLARVPEIIVNTLKCDVAVYSGYSKQNILGMKIAHILKKPTAYLMHGCVEYENAINLEPDEEMCKVERKTMELSKKVLAVSPSFALWLKENYPEYADKIDSMANGIDESLRREATYSNGTRDKHMIFTIGGGMPRKRIKYICEAVKLLIDEYDKDLKLYVVGNVGADSDVINSYPFVINEGLVPFERTKELFKKAGLFVQNSCFETFGLAPLEAIASGCSTLVSKQAGALCVLKDISCDDVINDVEDVRQIADKMRNLLNNPNNDRLIDNVDWESYSWEQRTKELVKKLENLLQ